MLNSLQRDIRELLDLVRDEATYRATKIATPSLIPGPAAEDEQHRKQARIQQLRERWDL
jgi:hypothetical protein